MKRKKITLYERLQQGAKNIRVSEHINVADTSPFVEKKMEKGRRLLSRAGVPKHGHVRPSR